MPIDQNFPKNHQVIGRHKHADREHFHFVWVQGDPMQNLQRRKKFKQSTKGRGEESTTVMVMVFENGV
jgi:hypothetical protein